ncbi:transforming acidic coiled-coil-containing protein 1 [Lasius niger]|uniref:Transforming acidic coiled-coil-containing protein 1 n=1 Tax=Lasius niger TaxID=67767 RepID=A0A0J7L0R4_LASNI|nr:transforming acidic coiled-coil-containing protein 1 [Lasius niger]
MEYINKLLHRASTTSPRTSPTPTLTSGNDNPVSKTAEHEVKVRFAREFADVGSVTENLCSAPESLSSASSFHSLSSTLSTKSSSGICPDSTLESSDDIADTSYVNSNIPGLEDLIAACADIHLESECDAPQDLSQDQTFASATDETPFHASDCSLNEDLPDNAGNETQVIERNPESHETTYVSLNQTDTFGPSKSTLPIQDSQFVVPYPVEEHIPQIEESIDKCILSQESDNIANKSETCGSANNIVKDSLPTNNADGNQPNVTTTISSDDLIPNVIRFDEEQRIENNRKVEILENPKLCPVEVSVPSISSLAQYAEGPSLPSISSISLSLEDTDIKSKENSAQDLSKPAQETSSIALSPPDDTHQKLCVLSQININSPVIQPEKNKIIEEQDLLRLNNCVVSDNQEDSTRLLNKISIIEPKILEVKENLQTNVDREDLEITNNVVLNKTQSFSPEKEIYNETHVIEEQCNPSNQTIIIEKEENIVDNAVSTDAVKEKETIEDLDRTLTLQEVDENFALDEEQYKEFKPQRQSTTLSLSNEQPDFEEFKSTLEKVTDELLNPSQELVEETDQFISATDEIFQDPSTFDFLLARSNSKHTDRLRAESLYVKFDPLISNTSMLPQGNAPPINEEQNGKSESPLPDVDTPKRNPAIAAIDRLLFYSPLPSGTVQKLEEAQEKNEQPVEEPKSDTTLIADHIDMSKELEVVRTTVLQLEEELEKQKKEHEAELERQKAAFQEKINKMQTQVAQEVKTKTQMTVVVEEYEKSISRLLTERERDRTNFEQEKAKLQEELQAANHHLTNTEAAFNDVHQKYERLKGVVSVYKNNEAVLKESIQENVDTIKTLETRYDKLKEHAMTQLEKANLELDGIRKQNEAETVKLHAMIRKAELKSNSLAELVEQKTKENKELAKILDEVIARVGHGNSE